MEPEELPAEQPTTDAVIDPIWEKMDGETNTAYVAFRTYLDMGPSRTILGAFRRHTRRNATVVSGSWSRWSQEFLWAARADAYDRRQRLQDMQTRAEIQKDVTVKWAQRRDETREAGYTIGKALLEKAQQMLRFPLATTETIKETHPDGSVKTVVIVEPTKWNLNTVARFVLVANQLMRLNAELETGRQRVDLKLIREEAEALAAELGVDPDEMILRAEQIAANAWGEDLAAE